MIEAILITIGIFVASAVLMAIPILATCAIILNWFGFLRTLLVILTFIEFIGLVTLLAEGARKK